HRSMITMPSTQCDKKLRRVSRSLGSLRSTPVDAFEQHRQLCGCQMHDTVLRARPDETAALQALVVKTQPLTVPPQHLDPITAPTAEHEQLTGERIVAQRRLHQRR